MILDRHLRAVARSPSQRRKGKRQIRNQASTIPGKYEDADGDELEIKHLNGNYYYASTGGFYGFMLLDKEGLQLKPAIKDGQNTWTYQNQLETLVVRLITNSNGKVTHRQLEIHTDDGIKKYQVQKKDPVRASSTSP